MGRHSRRQGACLASVVVVPAMLGMVFSGNRSSAWVPLAQSRREAARNLLGVSAAGLLGLPDPAAAIQRVTPEELAVNAIFERNAPGVLSVSDQPLDPDGNAPNRKVIGSGFAWDRNHVVTTYNMMKGVTRPRVVTVDNIAGRETHRTLNAAIVGSDPVSDVAVLWVDGDMTPLKRGSSQDLAVGQNVYALGNPFGLEHSMSKGVVSGIARSMEGFGGRSMSGVIQTDASVNPGNNGGPLLDSDGRVVGVNNAILSITGASSGVSFAVPIEAVERSVTSLITKGSVPWPTLGVTLSSDALARSLGLPGVMVKKVAKGGPADEAGVQPTRAGLVGDVIVGIDDSSVTSTETFFKALEGRAAGDVVKVSMMRPGESNLEPAIVKVRLASRSF